MLLKSNNAYSIFLLAILFTILSCNSPTERFKGLNDNKTKSMNDSIMHLLKKYDCVKEYEYAKTLIYAIYYRFHCLGSKCGSIPGHYTSIVPHSDLKLISTEMLLDIENKNPIALSGDTLCLRIVPFTNENCKCSYFEQNARPDGITLVRKSMKVIWIHNGTGYSFALDKEDIERTLTNSEMLCFIKQHKNVVNKWFYNEMIKRGYLND